MNNEESDIEVVEHPVSAGIDLEKEQDKVLQEVYKETQTKEK